MKSGTLLEKGLVTVQLLLYYYYSHENKRLKQNEVA